MRSFLLPRSRLPGGVTATVLLFLIQTTLAWSAERPLYFLTPAAVDPIALLPAPPITGSPEQLADMTTVVNARNTCTSNDLAVALEQNHGLTVFNLAPFLGSDFTSKRLPKTAALCRHAQSDTARFVTIAKQHFKRLRPSVVDTNLLVTTPALDFSYPSGHSAEATVIASILMELVPDQADRIFIAGRNAGWHRVQLARHYPSDIQAGRVLAQTVFRAMKSDASYLAEFAQAKGEIAAVLGRPLIPLLTPSGGKAAESAVH